ncbi:MAG: hypothetical protein ACNA7U_08830 [Candidatus Izemoplasmataceae bacterium]|jgi:hypothetical protein|uniref:hypothetical protein n=1 Tax=Liberiplasma polymorphum TaxID=3374570 RepID=UPI003772C697
MKQKINIEVNGKSVFKGKVLNIPVKHEKIIEKSLELFDDEDPCIIHTSFILKHYAEIILNLFEKENTTVIEGAKHQDDLDFLDVKSLDTMTITLL